MDDITDLANEICSYHDTARRMFVEELEVPLNKLDKTSVVGAIIIWKEKWQSENEESAKKALARKLMNLRPYWREFIKKNQDIPDQPKVNFKRCARQLDIQGDFVL